jgi:hypothetical protein
MGAVDRSLEGVWSGYIIKFGDPVPGAPHLTFHRAATYDAARLYTQGPVTAVTGDYPVGQIAHVKKDDIGLHIVMPLDSEELPPELAPFADRLVWTYIVDTARVTVTYREDDPMSGTKSPVLQFYPLVQVQYTIGEVANAVQAANVVVERGPKSDKQRSKKDRRSG